MGMATLIFLGGLIDKIICLALELFSNNIKPTEGKSMALLFIIYIPPYLNHSTASNDLTTYPDLTLIKFLLYFSSSFQRTDMRMVVIRAIAV